MIANKYLCSPFRAKRKNTIRISSVYVYAQSLSFIPLRTHVYGVSIRERRLRRERENDTINIGRQREKTRIRKNIRSDGGETFPHDDISFTTFLLLMNCAMKKRFFTFPHNFPARINSFPRIRKFL